MQSPGNITKRLVAVMAALLVCAAGAFGQDAPLPSLVEVYWQSSRSISAPNLTNPIVLDTDILRAEASNDTLTFYGLERGETIVVAYLKDKPISIRVRVIAKPVKEVSPSMRQRQDEMGQGSVSSNVLTSTNNGSTAVGLLDNVSWSQMAGLHGRLDFASQMEEDAYLGGHDFNLRTATLMYTDPTKVVQAGDFSTNLIGSGSQGFVNSYSFIDSTILRGGSFSLKRGENEYDVYAGTTVPFFYLTLGATRDVAAFSFRRQQTKKLSLFTTSTFIDAPVNIFGLGSGRRDNYMQTAGFSFTPNRRWTFRGAGGASNHGGMVRGEMSYQSSSTTVYAAGIMSSQLFPINQLGSLVTSTNSAKAGWFFRNKPWLTESVNYQHIVTQSIPGITTAGGSDYLSPSVWVKLGSKQDVDVEYDYSHNVGGFATDATTGNRVDAFWHYQVFPKISNTAQLTVGSFQDPLQIDSEDQFTFRDSVYFPVKWGSLSVGFEQNKTNPSLVEKLESELSLLSPALQSLFLADPVAFVNSSELPPEVRALLNAQVPIGTSISVAGQFHMWHGLEFSPSASLIRNTDGSLQQSWTPYFNYGLRYQLTPTLQLTSSLSNLWVLANSQGSVEHSMVFSVGITKNFRAAPSYFRSALHHGCTIEGRVFRDKNVNGVLNPGERGFDGIHLELENGESAVTDELGRYKFENVSVGQHHISLSLAQFPYPVRMTTPSDADVDLIRSRMAVVNFGVVDFSRLVGSVFNDLRLEGKRAPDSEGMPEIRLVLDDGRQKRTIVTENGDFELVDVPPGNYTLSVDPATVPANYVLSNESFPVHITPVSTLVQNVPVRALRSIAGRVYLKTPKDNSAAQTPGAVAPQANGPWPGSDYALVPMPGIHLRAGKSTAVSDEHGNFLLRDLPAGDLTIEVVPVRTMPDGMQAPSGKVHLPAEPIQVQGATIVIGNPDLVPYLVGKTAQEVRDDAVAQISKK